MFGGIRAVGAGDHAGELGNGLPPGGQRDDQEDQVGGQYPGGRVGQPEDIVALTAFLCSDAASHLSGTVITVRPPDYR